MESRALVLKDERFTTWHQKVSGRWSIEDLRANSAYRDGWISFDCLAWDHRRQALFVGLTSINTDIFWRYTPEGEAFTSLEFTRISDRFDAKLHRSLEQDTDGSYIMATAMLHDMDQQKAALGGKLVRYDPDSDHYEILGVPVPHHYIQSIVLDRDRRLVYGFTYPAEHLFVHDLTGGETRTLAYLGNAIMICQPHCAALDAEGRLWGTWGESRAFEDDPGPSPIRYFRYDPASGEFDWFTYGPPKFSTTDTGKVDHMLLARDGMIYVGSASGGLSKLDPKDGRTERIGKPFSGNRLAGLVEARSGVLYGAGNEGLDRDGRGTARMFRYAPAEGGIEDLGPIYDPGHDDGAIKIHMLCEGEDGVLYAGENDNPWRSSYLWRCKVEG